MLLRVLVGLLILLLVVLGGGYFYLRSSLPQVEGRITVQGLGAPVTIARDADGVPLITARNDADAAFGLGFAHAQDRLFQMETMRRYGAGRLSEIFGARTIGIDRQMRVLGLYRLAEASFAHLSAPVQRGFEAYAAGVNAFLATHRGALPPEFQLLRFAPEKWRPADSLVWGKVMDLELTGNYRGELLRARLARSLSPEQLAFLYPNYPKEAPTTLAELAAIYRTLPLDPLYAGLAPKIGPTYASNNWVVDGAHSAERQAVAGQRPASRIFRSGRLVSRAAQDAGARDRRRHGPGRAAGRDRSQRPDRLGLYDNGQRRRRSFHRKARPDRFGPVSDPGGQRSVRRRGGRRSRFATPRRSR